MRLRVELTVTAAACVGAYELARPWFAPDPAAGPAIQTSPLEVAPAMTSSQPSGAAPPRGATAPPPRGATAPPTSGATVPPPRGATSAPALPMPSHSPTLPAAPRREDTPPPDAHALSTLRNEALVTSAADMGTRGADLRRCLEGVQLAGTQKLRLAVDVDASPGEATVGRWRFVEIVDGEPLPATFAACAETTLGGGQHLVAPPDQPFPTYRGELSFVYTIPAPP